MSHARVEELSDSDPDIDDPSSYLPSNDTSIIQRADIPSTTSSSQPRSQPQPTTFPSSNIPFQPTASSQATLHAAREKIKTYSTLYPIYFDSTRTRSQGRRVSSKHAIANPLAFNLLPAIRSAYNNDSSLQLAFEPDKTHPKDWANPGRVRIQLRHPVSGDNLFPNGPVKNKAHLYQLVGRYLVDHPTTSTDPLQLKIQGVPVPENFGKEEIPVPRGWKVNKVLPVHSPAVSGGGVKDDFFKEAMEEMQKAQASGQLPAGMGGAGGGGMPDMSALQGMMGGMMGGGGMGGGGGLGQGQIGGAEGGKKKKDKKKG